MPSLSPISPARHIPPTAEIWIDREITARSCKAWAAELDIANRRSQAILLRIDSNGGSMIHALRLGAQIRQIGEVVAVVEGRADSAALCVFASAEHRLMRPHATILIHPVALDLSALEDERLTAETLAESAADVRWADRLFAQNTAQWLGIDPRTIKWFAAENARITASRALKAGICQEVLNR